VFVPDNTKIPEEVFVNPKPVPEIMPDKVN